MQLYCLQYLQLTSLEFSLKCLHQIALCNGEILFFFFFKVFSSAGHLEKASNTLLTPLYQWNGGSGTLAEAGYLADIGWLAERPQPGQPLQLNCA